MTIHPDWAVRCARRRWLYITLVGVIALNLRLLFYCMNNSATAARENRVEPPSIFPQLPFSAKQGASLRVACFFMVGRDSTEEAVAVRYSNWAKQCSHFVIFSNGVALESGGEAMLDRNTLIIDIHRAMQLEFRARGMNNITISATYGTDLDTSEYMIFPSPESETKQYLAIKSFYSWMHMARNYADKVDYIMKADPDTYMIMDNYFDYLYQNHNPQHNVYVGRVFKSGGSHREPFVTGLSVTLSKTTAKQFLSKSSIHMIDNDKNNYPSECSAESFRGVGAVEDWALSSCLSSMGVYPAYTRDEVGRELFLHFDPSNHFYQARQAEPDWYKTFSFTPHLPRSKCCSDKACAFHYVNAGRMNDTLVWDRMFEVWHWEDGV